MGETGVEMRLPGAVRATGVGPQLQGGASGVCETRGSHRAVAGGLGKGLAGKSATQRASQVVAGEFQVAVGVHRAIELKYPCRRNCHLQTWPWGVRQPFCDESGVGFAAL